MHPVTVREMERNSKLNATLPKRSNGRPIKAIILLRSEVRNDVGRESVGARAAKGGEPQSSSVCSNPIRTAALK